MLCLLLFSSVAATALKSPGFALRVSLLRGGRNMSSSAGPVAFDSHPFQRLSWNQWILSCSSRFGKIPSKIPCVSLSFHKQDQLREAGGRKCQQHSHFCIYNFCKPEVQIVCRISITPLLILSCAISSLWKQGFQRVRKSFELVIYNGFEYSDKVTGQSRGDSCGQ